MIWWSPRMMGCSHRMALMDSHHSWGGTASCDCPTVLRCTSRVAGLKLFAAELTKLLQRSPLSQGDFGGSAWSLQFWRCLEFFCSRIGRLFWSFSFQFQFPQAKISMSESIIHFAIVRFESNRQNIWRNPWVQQRWQMHRPSKAMSRAVHCILLLGRHFWTERHTVTYYNIEHHFRDWLSGAQFTNLNNKKGSFNITV